MSTNRNLYYIKNILQNSKLNSEKFVKSKKKYNENFIKNKTNHNLILHRKFGTTSFGFPPSNNNNNNKNKNKGPNWIFILMMASASYIVSEI